MVSVSDMIEAAAAFIPNSVYMRATDVQANIGIEEIDLALDDKVLVLYSDLPTVKHTVTAGIQRQWPVEIKLLKLDEVDGDTVDGDALRAELIPAADLLFDALLLAPEISQNTFPTSYELDFLNFVKIYDDVLTGITLKFIMYFDRNKFCVPRT